MDANSGCWVGKSFWVIIEFSLLYVTVFCKSIFLMNQEVSICCGYLDWIASNYCVCSIILALHLWTLTWPKLYPDWHRFTCAIRWNRHQQCYLLQMDRWNIKKASQLGTGAQFDMHKTLEKITQWMYWVNLRVDVNEWCRYGRTLPNNCKTETNTF